MKPVVTPSMLLDRDDFATTQRPYAELDRFVVSTCRDGEQHRAIRSVAAARLQPLNPHRSPRHLLALLKTQLAASNNLLVRSDQICEHDSEHNWLSY